MTDERQGKPSASGIERLALCPGSLNAQRGLAERPSDEADAGTLMHDALAGKTVKLSAEQDETVDACRQQAEAVISQFRADHGRAVELAKDDARLWSEGHRYSGKPDWMLQAVDGWVLIIDYKTLWGDHDPAGQNWQLAALMLLAMRNYSPPGVRVAMVQPRTGRPTVADWTEESAQDMRRTLYAVLDAAETEDAPRRVHPDACRYCRANGTPRCPESAANIATVAGTANGLDAWGTYEDGEKRNLWLMAKAAKQAAALIEARVYDDMTSGRPIDGLKLSPGTKRRTISDVPLVAQRLMDAGTPVEKIQAACSIGIGDLEDVCREQTGLKGKALAAFVEKVTDGAVEVKQSKQSVERA